MIKINKIKLINFMSCSNVELDLSDKNIIVLSGKNGQGKSTIFDALAFSLASFKRADKFQEYIKRGKNESLVYVDCTFSGEKLEITTEMKLARNTCNLEKTVSYKGNIYHNSEANEFLKSLKLDFFADIFFSMQDGQKISDMTPSVRSNYLKQILNINFTDEISAVEEQIKEFSDLIQTLDNKRGLLENQNADYNKRIEEAKSSLKVLPYSNDVYIQNKTDLENTNSELSVLQNSDISKKMDSLSVQIKDRETELLSLKKSIEDVERQEKENKDNEIKKSEYKSEIEKLSEQVKNVSSLDEERQKLLSDISEIDSQIKEVEKSMNNLQFQIKSKNSNIQNASLTDLETKSDEIEKTLNPIRTKDDVEKDIEDCKSQTAIYNQKIAEIKEQIEGLNGKKVCPLCHHEVSDDFIDNLKKSLSDFESGLKDYADKRNEFNVYLNKLAELDNIKSDIEQVKEIDKIRKEIDKYDEQIKALLEKSNPFKNRITEIDTIINNQKSIKEKIAFYENEITKLRFYRIPSITDKKENAAKVETEIKTLKDEYLEISIKNNDSVSALLKKQKELMEAISLYENIDKQNISAETTSKNLKETIDKNEEELETLNKNLNEYNNKLAVYNAAKKVFSDSLPNHIIIYVSRVLQDLMNSMIERIFPNFKCKLLKKKSGVEFFYDYTNDIENKDEKDLNSIKMASGFEKSLMTIIFKLSLCKMYGISFSLLDEIDSAADDENSENLFNMILGSNIVEQLFIITHKPYTKNLLQDFSDKSVVYSVSKGNFAMLD